MSFMLQMNCCLMMFRLIFHLISIQIYINFSDGISWEVKPDEFTYGQQGTNISIRWKYELKLKEKFDNSILNYKSHDITTALASKSSNEHSHAKYSQNQINLSFAISGAENVSLTIHYANKVLNNGKFCFEVHYKLIAVKEKREECTTLFVYDLPRISYLTSQHFGKQGESITLRCNASGDPAPRITWIHKDKNRTIANSSVTSFNITGKESGGKYCCHVSNGFGEEANCTSVKVTEYQPINTKLTSDVKFATANKTFQVFCNADASPPANYFIKQGNITMVNSSDGNVTITAPNNGMYLAIGCIAKNKYGQETANSFRIPIYQPPTIVYHPNPRITIENDSIILQCQATGTPRPNITWFDKIRNTTVEAANGTLLVQNEDCKNRTLQYNCVASNVVEDVKSPSITVEAFQRKSVSFCKKKESKNNDESILHSGPNWLLIIIVVVCPLVTVALILAFILFSRKRKKSKRDMDKGTQSVAHDIRQNQSMEESPYGEPVDAIRVRSVINISASNAAYATVEETGYKPVITSKTVQQPTRDETFSSKKVKSNVEPVYAKVNKNKKKDKSADVQLNPLYDKIPADLSNQKHPSSLSINHQDPKTSDNQNSNEEEDGVDSVDQGGSWIPWLY